ncbi:MAG: hypothetical protein JW774_08915, partial [Candidatus Aureabacteria bacterium]|nr:hypothetical protein [Candidatus Auribacterota bacterium]
GNEKAAWCSVRTCCLENHFSSCAECRDFTDISLCKKFNNIFSKIFGFIFRSDRKACIQRIRETGIESYAREMTEKKIHSIKR